MLPTPSVLVLNGPNLNLLGLREPAMYGSATLADVEALCRDVATRHGLDVEFRQSNHEGELIDAVHAARTGGAAAIVVNAAGYTHTSVALRDALATVDAPVVEVHITNIHQREPYRHHSYVAEVADSMICGAGVHGYALALTHVAHLLEKNAA